MRNTPGLSYLTVYFSLLLFASACGTTSRINKRTPVTGQVIETGVASWYGPNFHGKLTANGENYDMHGLTAAHRTLPFNTLVRVENIDNGKSVDVRINDRGPFAKNRIIDLSKRAAQEIDMLGPGTAHVRLVLIDGDLKNSRTTDLKIATYTVQLGSFETRPKAVELAEKIDGSRIEKINIKGKNYFRVHYGIYSDKEKSEKKREQLARMGFKGFVKQIEND